jgi:putative FmdB family regulatory protein
MPLYDYECKPCKLEFEAQQKMADRKTCSCPNCGRRAKLFIKPGKAPGFAIFQPGWWRDISFEPLYINNPQELRDACDRNNSYSECLENGTWKTSPGPDPEHL